MSIGPTQRRLDGARLCGKDPPFLRTFISTPYSEGLRPPHLVASPIAFDETRPSHRVHPAHSGRPKHS
jgi:hypothetical protein